MFVCCHPAIAQDARVILALKMLGGFSISEIARAFLSSEAAIEKQLTRTKQRIAAVEIPYELPDGEDLSPRLVGVLGVIYLIFNEGHKATTGDHLLREDLCREAIRLVLILAEHPAGNQPGTHALLALMLLTAARFPTRVDTDGNLMRLEEQDRGKWDELLIARGLHHLAKAAHGRELSEYHLQAGIAAIHATAADAGSTDWGRILLHYDALYLLQPSPVVALNRAVAVAQVHGPQTALDVIAAMPDRQRLESDYLLHTVTGELHWRLRQHEAAAACFRRALSLTRVGPEHSHLMRLLARTMSEAPPLSA
jgi:RNA polymerase sigma-70 factor (ECF subfamily)